VQQDHAILREQVSVFVGFSKARYPGHVLMIYLLDSMSVARYWTRVNWKLGPARSFRSLFTTGPQSLPKRVLTQCDLVLPLSPVTSSLYISFNSVF
jgi:hypothetical protein